MKLVRYQVESGTIYDTQDWLAHRIVAKESSYVLFEANDHPDSFVCIDPNVTIFRRYIKFIFPSDVKVELLVKR